MENTKRIEENDLSWKIEQAKLRAQSAKELIEKNHDNTAKKNDIASILSSGDSVKFSLAKEIQAQLNTDNSDKVARIKALLAKGEYKPDLTKVAESLTAAIDDEITFDKLGNA